MESTRAARADAQRNLLRSSARRGLGGLPAYPDRSGAAAVVGPGADGDPRKRPNLPAGAADPRHYPRRGARCPLSPLGNGRGAEMPGALLRHWRTVGRPARARLYGDPETRGRRRTLRSGRLFDSPRRARQFERGPDALASFERALACASVRSPRSRSAGVGCRAVQGARPSARPVEHRR